MSSLLVLIRRLHHRRRSLCNLSPSPRSLCSNTSPPPAHHFPGDSLSSPPPPICRAMCRELRRQGLAILGLVEGGGRDEVTQPGGRRLPVAVFSLSVAAAAASVNESVACSAPRSSPCHARRRRSLGSLLGPTWGVPRTTSSTAAAAAAAGALLFPALCVFPPPPSPFDPFFGPALLICTPRGIFHCGRSGSIIGPRCRRCDCYRGEHAASDKGAE